MRRLGFILLTGICLLVFVVPIRSQEISDIYTDSLSVDSFAIDSFDPDPEWYVAPEVRVDYIRASKRANANTCPTDSVLIFNIDSVLVEVTVYEYGDTTRTMVWTVNADGSRFGKSKTEEASTSTASFNATYAWDNTTNDWKGTSKTEHIYANNKETTRILYNTWLNNAWVADTKYTWIYDASGRETEYTTYTRNTSTNELVLSQQRIREWYNNSKLTLEIQYTAHNGTEWSAGTKKEYDYDAAGNQIEYTYYSSLSNGNWIGSTHEEWTYNAANKKTYYAKQTWKNGAWSNTSKEEYAYNAANKQTLKIVYTGSGTTWTESTKEVSDYNAAGSKTLSAKYKWKNGAWVGNGSRTETEYVGSKQSVVVTSSWSTAVADWIYATRHSYTYDGAGKTIADTTKTYTNSAWVNNALLTHAFDDKGNDTLAVTSAWNGTDWTAASITKGTYTYTASGLPLLAETYTGLGEVWIGNQKIEYAYNEAGSQTLYISYDWYNGDWRGKQKTEKEYDANNRLILSENYTWRNSAWAGNNKYEYAYDTYGRQCMTAQYTWSNNDWKGLSKTEQTMDANGVVHTSISYTWRENDWVGTFKYDYTYDNAGHTTDKVIYYFQNNQWGNDQRYTYAFDARGQEIYSHEYRWVNGNWQMISAHEKTYDEADNKLRRDITGSWNTNGNVSSYTDMHYFYACDPHYYTIRFVNYDGAELSSESILEGQTPSFSGTEPTKPQDTQYTYSFSGWTPSITSVSGNATYTATYTSTPRQYTITWLNEDGTEISHETLEYGATPTHADINKESTAEFTYTFAGWTPGIGIVTGDATYTAQFNATKNSYYITWLNEDNSQIDQTLVEYGVVPTHTAPTKEATDEHSYFFDKWTPDVVAVTGEATYKASYTETTKVYTITWLNENGTEISHETLEYGANPTHVDPTKEATDEFTYTFAGWNPAVTSVTGDASYMATYTATKRSYTITWLNEDGSEIEHETLEYGATPMHADVTKENTAEFTYAFTGWTPQVVAVTGDAEYTATFTATKNSYTITWKNEDGSVMETETLAYGATPTHEDIYKESTAEYTYTFAGWTPQITAVTGDAEYTALFDSTVNQYTVTFYWENGTTILRQMQLSYGELPTISVIPARNADNQCSYYSFAGWEPEIVPVTGNASYMPTYTEHYYEYMVTFRNYNRQELQYSKQPCGFIPNYEGTTPTKPGNAQYSYVFTGWTPELTELTGEAIYTATFEKRENIYTIIFLDEDNSELDRTEVAYGQMPSTSVVPTKEDDEQYTYTFAGWSPQLKRVTGDATYTATYKPTAKTEGINNAEVGETATKVIIDNQIFIRRGGKTYTIDGQRVQ